MKYNLLHVPESETLAINALAKEKKAKGETVYNLSAGEPMLSVPKIVKEGVMHALSHEETHYPPIPGIPELRKEISLWMNKNYGTKYSSENTLVTAGGKFGLYILIQAFIQKGDEVLIQSPYWVSYPRIVEMFGGKSIVMDTSEKDGWKISAKHIQKYATKKTKLCILNNGSNPTGAIYSKKELEEILSECEKRNIFVISDEIYSTLVYDNKKYVSAGSFSFGNVAVLQSASKSFAMTGLRVGYIFSNKEIIGTLSRITSQSTSGVTTLSQYAALYALKKADAISGKIRTEVQKRRDVLVKEIQNSLGKKVPKPVAGLYVFMPLSVFGTKEDSHTFCMRAMREANVAIVPGSAFGKEGYVRLSFGEKAELLRKGVRKLAGWVKKN